METPVAFPSLAASPLTTYVVNDREASLRATTSMQINPSADDNPAFGPFGMSAVDTRGSSSVSEFPQADKILVTSPVHHRRGVLAVTLLSLNHEEPRTMHLDLRSECSVFATSGVLAAVKAFEITSTSTKTDTPKLFQLVLVDDTAVVLSMRFTMDTFMPVAVRTQSGTLADLRCWEVDGGNMRDTDTVRLCSTLVAFIDQDTLLLALYPHLVAANLAREETHVWSEAQCLEDMRNRASGVLRILKRGADILTGGFTTDCIADLSPIAAVCAVRHCVFTLHSDGVLRHWIYHSNSIQGPASLLPFAVRVVRVQALPDTSTWVDGWNTTYLTAALQNADAGTSSFVLGLHIHTSESSATGGIDDISHSRTFVSSRWHALIIVEGSVDIVLENDKNAGTDPGTSSFTLNVPKDVTGLVGMQFVHAECCQLRAMFRTERTNSILVTYPLDQDTIPDPIVVPAECTLDGVAQQELERINKLSFLPYCRLEDDTASMDQILPELDSRFLQFLFRPAFPRGNGTILPPSEAHIGSAMRKLLPLSSRGSQHHNNINISNSYGIELQVARFIQEWRRRDQHHNVIASMTPLRQKTTTASMQAPDTAMAYAGYNTPGAESILTLYDALDADDDDDNNDAAHTPDGQQDQIEDRLEMEMLLVRDEQTIQDHERRWRTLLKEIWTEECLDRAPLCMAIPTQTTSVDAAIIVRPGCISVLVQNVGSAEGPLTSLDRSALEMLAKISSESFYAKILEDAELFALESLARGEMALVPRHVRELKERINQMDASLLTPAEMALWQEHIANNMLPADNPWDGANLLGNPFLPGLCLLPKGDEMPSWENASRRLPVLSSPSRLAAASIVVRAADSARRLSLARFLALSEVMDSSGADAALLQYLHSLNVMCVAARTVPFPPISVVSSTDLQQLQLDATSSPPAAKRTKVTSILEQSPNKTVVLDSLLIQLSQRVGQTTDKNRVPSLHGYISALCGAAAMWSFQVGGGAGGAEWGNLPPELGLLCLPAAVINPPAAPLVVRLLAPAVALPLQNESEVNIKKRKVLLARCLLLASNSAPTPDKAKAMIGRAFALLPFDANDVAASMEQLGVLEARTGGNVVAGQRLLAYINDAIAQVEMASPADLDSLHSRRFNTALTIRDWGAAHTACQEHPNLKRKAENFKRLVRGMVDAGALSVLVDKCRSTSRDAETFQQVDNLYPIAVETLAEIGSHDIFTFSESASDYQAALYDLHVSHGDWRSVGQALDSRYLQARQVLASINAPSNLGDVTDDHEETIRVRLAVNDMVLASIGTYNAMLLVSDSKAAYLVSGIQTLYPAIPPQAFSDRVGGGGLKHSREGKARSADASGNISHGQTYWDMDSIELRAVKCNVLKTLYDDDPLFAMSALMRDDSVNEVVDRLFLRGFYNEGLMLATVMAKAENCKPEGYGLFHDAVSRLIVEVLLPVAVDPKCSPERPTLRQLQAGMESLGGAADPPVLIAGSHYKKARLLARTEIRTGAMNLIRLLVLRYSSAEQPLAVELASEMLTGKYPLTVLPSWLEQIVLFGSTLEDLPGLFSRRRLPTTNDGYLGDPSRLLSLYIHRGLYTDACRVVCSVLEGPRHDFRQAAAPSRVPEKGEVDCLPIQNIDMLWNLIELSVKNGRFLDCGSAVLQARSSMEQSLTKYFELLGISDSGAKSTRALSPTSSNKNSY